MLILVMHHQYLFLFYIFSDPCGIDGNCINRQKKKVGEQIVSGFEVYEFEKTMGNLERCFLFTKIATHMKALLNDSYQVMLATMSVINIEHNQQHFKSMAKLYIFSNAMGQRFMKETFPNL